MDGKDNKIAANLMIKCGDKLIDLRQPLVMGIINVTPDSFYEGSRVQDDALLLSRIQSFISQGVDIIDVGAVSTRPGAHDVDEVVEMDRMNNAVKLISKHFPNLLISVDTFRSRVAKSAVQNGAHMINDISGGSLDEEMFRTVAVLKVPYILMHSRGNPTNMQQLTDYENVSMDVVKELSEKIEILRKLGVYDIIVDPGFGFAKTLEQNFKLLNDLTLFSSLGCPILAGLSRKSMIYKTLNGSPKDALNGTTALNMVALLNGANILRVHDVKEAREVVELYLKMVE
jgi:dihydropteroate synthase